MPVNCGLHLKKTNRQGFTLPEALMVTGILGIVVGAMFVNSVNQQNAFFSMDNTIQAQEEVRRAMDVMVKELREANAQTCSAVKANNNSKLDFQLALGYNLAAPCPADATCWGAWSKGGLPMMGWKVRYSEVARSRGTKTITQGKQKVVVNDDSGVIELIRQVIRPDGTVESERTLAPSVVGDTESTSFACDADNKAISVSIQTQTPTSSLLPGGIRSSGRLTAKIKLRN